MRIGCGCVGAGISRLQMGQNNLIRNPMFLPIKATTTEGCGPSPQLCLQPLTSAVTVETLHEKRIQSSKTCECPYSLQASRNNWAEIWEVVWGGFTIFPRAAITVPFPSPCSHPVSPLFPSSLLQRYQSPTSRIGAPSAHCHSARVPRSLCSPKVSPRSALER